MCLPVMQRYDVTIPCPDGEDEMDCLNVDRDCEEREFRCIQYRQCVPGARRCDGTPDCLDGSYEWYGCTKTTTTRPVLDLEIRLMDGQSDVTGKMRRGRVEARLPGSDDKFGTVCGDIWTDKEATVVCRSLYTE
ncbi:low-density lipoprotein receptor-like [Dreissena polymorpha]|uniref:low-density lipoprotein receptor-like n=1 Tax=Dreissena polymorpha TaxID=45954 RepID=UPI002263AD51|nr:low-density lipoprotein receptor-like [Dreissena polymorpha]